MATANKKASDTTDFSMEEKIVALYELQCIDSKIDEISKLKGELPLEVQDLEDKVAGLQTRMDNIAREIEDLNLLAKQRKDEIEESKALIARYEEQQRNVRNNREFDSLSKEMEYQTLEIELREKRLKEHAIEMKVKAAQAEDAEAKMKDRQLDLEAKRAELKSIEQETAAEVETLKKQQDGVITKIDERLLSAYNRIRSNVRNGLGVVTVRRDACGGCFNRIPPQRQFEISQSRKVIVCEYCGRILVSDELIGGTEE